MFTYDLLFLQNCVLLKTLKNGVFSQAQLLCITDNKIPFQCPFPKWHFCNQKCHFGFSHMPAETPIFAVFGDLNGHKKYHVPKQIVSSKMPFLPSEHKSCLPIFLKMSFLQKNLFVHNHPTHTISRFFF